MYYINTLKQELSTAKHISITGLMRRLSLIDVDAAKFGVFVDENHSKLPTIYWLLKLQKNDPISHVLLLILVLVQLLSCLFF